MDKRLKTLLTKSTISIIVIISLTVILCCLFLSVTRYALPIVCIIIPSAVVLALRIVIHTAMYSYLYINYDGNDTEDEQERKVTSIISKIDSASRIITVISVGVVLILAIVGRIASPAVSGDISTADFMNISVENADIKSEKYFSNCITNYYFYGEKCNNYATTMSVEKIINCPKWFIKYHYDKNRSMLDKRHQAGEVLTVKDVSSDRYSCAYVLRDNGAGISIVAMKDNNYIELTVSAATESEILVDTEKALNYIEEYFNQ